MVKYNNKKSAYGNYKKKAGSAAMVKVARRVAKQVVRKNTELKCKQIAADEAAVTTIAQGANMYDISSLTNGTAGGSRLGNEVRATGFHMKGILNNNSTTTTNYVRMIVCWVKDQADLTSVSGIFRLGTTDTDFGSVTGLNTMYTPFSSAAVTVLYDKVIKLAPANTGGGGAESKQFAKFIKLNKKIQYRSNANGTDTADNRLHFGIWAAEGPDDTTTGNTVEFSTMMRFWFADA